MSEWGPSEALSAILVIVTIIYAILTWRIAKSSEASARYVAQQMEHLIRPFLNVNISTRHKTVLSIVVTNGGKTSAKNVSLRMDKPFYQFAERKPERNIQDFNLFAQVIPSISPGDRFMVDLSQGFNINTIVENENVTPDQFTISASYESGPAKYEETFHIDLKPYFQTFAGEHEVEELINIGKQLKEISVSIKKLGSK